MNDIAQFNESVKLRSQEQYRDIEKRQQAIEYLISFGKHYSYNFSWLGMPIIQIPQDIIAMQEIIWRVKPDLIIETGVARGGSLIFYSSLLQLIDEGGEVLGIDVDIRSHNYEQIVTHPCFKRITLLEGSSIEDRIKEKVLAFANNKSKIMVCLDSSHTHEHVLEELEFYAPLVSLDSYCVVYDTVVEDYPENAFPDRPWGKGDNPKTAVHEYLKAHDEFMIDTEIEGKILMTVAPDGYLKRVK